MTALIYGERPIRITEKFSSPHPISAEKNAKPLCCSIIAESQRVFTPGIGTAARNL
jgi:hypothetical protein